MRLPNFFIIGAPKCGTTSLARYLGEHPRVFLSTPKELFYWSDDHPHARKRYEIHTLDRYLTFFRGIDPQQHLAVGEGSTNYLQSRTAVPNILEFEPSSRFIVLLRDPFEVAYAMHEELTRHFFEDELDFHAAWQLQRTRAQGERIPQGCAMVNQLQYRDVVNYADQLQRLYEHVPTDQRLVILFDDLKDDPGTVYRRCLDFLGLADDGRSDFPHSNTSRQYRPRFIARMYQNPPHWIEPVMRRFREWYAARPNGLRNFVTRTLSRSQARATLNPEFVQELRQTFLVDVEAVEKRLDVDLPHWKPQQVLAAN